MARQTRWQFLSRFFKPVFSGKPATKRPPGKPTKATWLVTSRYFEPVTVQAVTKSEARAEAKRVLGISGSLPAGTVAERK